MKQQILTEQEERRQRDFNLERGGEVEHKKEFVPNKEECRQVSHECPLSHWNAGSL